MYSGTNFEYNQAFTIAEWAGLMAETLAKTRNWGKIMINENVEIELRDGRRLAARLWLPEGARQNPLPAILEYLPYRLRDGTAECDEGNYVAFAAAGYVGVRVDIAGNGDSDGYMADEYLEDELASGEEVIEWIAAQPWCSGAVGMIGISWGGYNGLQIAMRRPPALKAIVTVGSTHDRYEQCTHYIGGCLLNDNFNWGAQMTAVSSSPPDPEMREDWREVWLERLQRLPFLAADWLRHQRHSAHWKHGSVCEDWHAIQCPVLAVGGWADSYSDTPPVLAEHLSAPVKALMGPWEHRYPHLAKVGPRADFHGEVSRWFDRWLKGEQNGAEQLPAYRAYIQSHRRPSPKLSERAGRWVGEAQWPSSSPPLILQLAPGVLAAAPAAAADIVVCSAQDVGEAAGNYCPGMRVDDELSDEQRRDDEKSVCFDGAPLAVPLEILGAPEVEIEFSAAHPQGLLAFRLCDVAPDGTSDRVSFMVFNLTHHGGHERPADLRPQRRYRVRIALRHCGHCFAATHRLRLAVSTAYWPMVWPSPAAAAVTLHLENCRLILPQRRETAGEEKFAPALPPAENASAFEKLRPAAGKTERITLADGTCQLTISDDLGETRNPHNGMESGATVCHIFSIHPDNPLSARAETTWVCTHRRGDWHTQVRSENTMTASAHEFRLFRKIAAYAGEVLVLEKTWDETVPRDCC